MSEENKQNEQVVNQNEQENNKNDTKCTKKSKKLTDKQRKFIDEYLIDLNATRAYKTVYINCKSDEAANAASSRLLRNVKVQEEIEKQQQKIQERTQVTQDKVINELAKIAFSNATDYVEIQTRKIKHRYWDSDLKEFVYEEGDVYEQDIVLKDTKELNQDQKAAIASIKNTRHGIAIEQCNKVEALRLLGQHLGLFKDNAHINIQNNIPENPYNGLSIEELKALAKMKKCDANAKS